MQAATCIKNIRKALLEIWMKCKFITGRYMLACRIGPHSYVPSSFEIEEYCKTARHRICPLYFSFQGGRQREQPHDTLTSTTQSGI
jgi:hypothetical protein